MKAFLHQMTILLLATTTFLQTLPRVSFIFKKREKSLFVTAKPKNKKKLLTKTKIFTTTLNPNPFLIDFI